MLIKNYHMILNIIKCFLQFNLKKQLDICIYIYYISFSFHLRIYYMFFKGFEYFFGNFLTMKIIIIDLVLRHYDYYLLIIISFYYLFLYPKLNLKEVEHRFELFYDWLNFFKSFIFTICIIYFIVNCILSLLDRYDLNVHIYY